MALFKISKGEAANLPSTYNEGYCYFTTDDGKFYIDTTNTAVGRIALNAVKADQLSTARTLTIGNTGKTFNGSSNVSWTLNEIGATSIAVSDTQPTDGSTFWLDTSDDSNGDLAYDGGVRYDITQSLTTAQKSRALTNIGAASSSALSTLNSLFSVNINYGALVETSSGSNYFTSNTVVGTLTVDSDTYTIHRYVLLDKNTYTVSSLSTVSTTIVPPVSSTNGDILLRFEGGFQETNGAFSSLNLASSTSALRTACIQASSGLLIYRTASSLAQVFIIIDYATLDT